MKIVIFSLGVVCMDLTIFETLVLCIWSKNFPENTPNKSPVALLLHQSLYEIGGVVLVLGWLVCDQRNWWFLEVSQKVWFSVQSHCWRDKKLAAMMKAWIRRDHLCFRVARIIFSILTALLWKWLNFFPERIFWAFEHYVKLH